MSLFHCLQQPGTNFGCEVTQLEVHRQSFIFSEMGPIEKSRMCFPEILGLKLRKFLRSPAANLHPVRKYTLSIPPPQRASKYI